MEVAPGISEELHRVLQWRAIGHILNLLEQIKVGGRENQVYVIVLVLCAVLQ